MHISAVNQLLRCSPETFTNAWTYFYFLLYKFLFKLSRDFDTWRFYTETQSAFASVSCSRSILFVCFVIRPNCSLPTPRRTLEYSFVTMVTSEPCKFALFVTQVMRRIIEAFLKISYVKSHVNSICVAFA